MNDILLRVTRENEPPRFMPNNEQNLHSLNMSIQYGRENMRVELVEVINNDYGNPNIIRVISESDKMQVETEANTRISAKDALNRKLREDNERLQQELESLKAASNDKGQKPKSKTTEIISEL